MVIPDIEDHSNISVISRKNLMEICNIILPPLDLAHVYFWRALESIEGTEGKSQYLPKQVKKFVRNDRKNVYRRKSFDAQFVRNFLPKNPTTTLSSSKIYWSNPSPVWKFTKYNCDFEFWKVF